MSYPDIAIQALINSLMNDEEAYTWLVNSEWKELAALDDALYANDNEAAINFLIGNKEKFATVVNFLGALKKQEKAFDYLMKNDKVWAAVVNAVHRSGDAYDWLVKNNYDLYAKLAEVLIDNTPVYKPGTITM
jgi:hypothetical protein